MKGIFPYSTILILLLLSCNKKEKDIDEPKVYNGGRVVLINSDTPVPNAVIRFAKWANTCLTCPMQYIEVATDTTDDNGHFDIPSGTDATMAIAFGNVNLFNRESEAGNVNAYWEDGGEMTLELVAPAWVRVSAMDIPPLNPEINYVKAHPSTGGYFPATSIMTPQIWKVDCNTEQYIGYLFIYNDQSQSSLLTYNIGPPEPYDTTEYVIEY